jgi:hypothetical protein
MFTDEFSKTSIRIALGTLFVLAIAATLLLIRRRLQTPKVSPAKVQRINMMSDNHVSPLNTLKTRIDTLIQSGKLDEKSAEQLVKRWGYLSKRFASVKDPLSLEHKIAGLTAHVALLEAPPSLQRIKETRAETASKLMTTLSLIALIVLISTNWLSMLISTQYNWPKGWFISDVYLGFALAGVSINILLRLRNRIQRGDWENKYLGTHVSRILQATVYAALIYWFVGSLPGNAIECTERGLNANCWQTRANIPFAPAALLIGLFVHLVEEALVGVGERFVDMISALFSTQFVGSRQKEAKNQELRKLLETLRSQYSQIEDSQLDEPKKQSIKQLFEDALSLLQSNENDQAESKLQELGLEMKIAT